MSFLSLQSCQVYSEKAFHSDRVSVLVVRSSTTCCRCATTLVFASRRTPTSWHRWTLLSPSTSLPTGMRGRWVTQFTPNLHQSCGKPSEMLKQFCFYWKSCKHSKTVHSNRCGTCLECSSPTTPTWGASWQTMVLRVTPWGRTSLCQDT